MWPLAIDAARAGPAPAVWLRGCLALFQVLLRALALCLYLCLGLGLPMAAQAGTYRADSSAANATLYPWIDSTSGTSLNLGDNGLSATIAIGFNFTLGTTVHTGLRIDANGTVQFGGAPTTNVTYALPLNGASGKPNVDAILMPLWDDLYPDSGNITYKLTGTSPNRVFTISWISSQYRCSYYLFNSLTCYLWGQTGWTSDSATFQVQLHENGTIVYRYGNVQGNGGAHWNGDFTNGGATIGIEVSDSNYTQFSRNSASISSGTTIVWTQYIPTLVSGQRYSFESYDVAGSYIRQFSPLASISALTEASSLANRQDASFIARPGLSNSSCWSFESVNNPGYYLRHFSFRLRLDVYSASGSYPADATFCERAGLSGSGNLSFESANYAGYYIRHLADLTVGISATDGSGTYNDRATWNTDTALSEAVRLVAQWDMESVTTNTTPDSSGNGNSLSLGASGVSLVNGADSYGLGLNGASPAAGSSTGAALATTGSYTVMGWVKFNTLTACQAQAVVSQDGTTVHPFEIVNTPGCALPQSLYFEILATDADASSVKRVYATFSPVASTWYHVAGVFNAATATMSFYVNCTLQGTQTSVTTFSASGAFTVGRSKFSGSNRDYLNGSVDGVKVWQGVRTASEISTECTNMPRQLLAEYRFDEAAWAGTAGEVADSAGSAYNASAAGLSSTRPATSTSTPVVSGSPGTCAYGSFNRSNKQYVSLPAGLPNLGASTGFTATAWFRTTDRTLVGQRILADDENNTTGFILSLGDRGAGMLNFYARAANTGTELVTGALVADNTWYFVAVAVNLATKTKYLYLFDAAGNGLAGLSTTFTAAAFNSDAGVLTIGGESNTATGSENTSSYGFAGDIDEVRLYNNALAVTEIAAVRQLTRSCPNYGPDHLQIEHDGAGLTCTPETVTIKACANSSCSSLYTSGAVSGNLTWSGAASSSAAFSITSGQSSTTVSLPVTAVGSVTLGSSGVSPSTGTTTCLNTASSATSCAVSFADSGLLFDVPHHRAEASQSLTVTAVKKADNSAACVPAFQNVTKSVRFTCAYSNPATGTKPVRVGNVALNATNSTSAACDGTGGSVSLNFDATGAASTTLLYGDAGAMTLTGVYTGSGADAGLDMRYTDSFIAAPYDFAVTVTPSTAIAAGSNFSTTVTARNYSGNATPNFGRETTAEGATLGFVRTGPSGSAAVSGSFSGNLGSFSNGAATGSALTYSEVGSGNVSAVLTSGSYLGTGFTLAGSSEGNLVSCAAENATCTLPAGATATVYFNALGRAKVVSGLTGAVSCSNATFGDPYMMQTKACSYAVTSGTKLGATAAAVFKPHHFTVAVTRACVAGAFSYAGQPFGVTVNAVNAAGAATVNYDGTANTSPNHAKATTLSDANALGVGSLSGHVIALGAFSGGQAIATPTYTFTSKQTAAQTLVMRATDADGVASSSPNEGNTPLRSGRLRLSNATGSAKSSLQVPVTADYWSGNAWVLNSADQCTTLAAASVALSNGRNALGNASAATSSASAVTLVNGQGNITLGAPSPVGSGVSYDMAVNLGSTAADQSCLANHPASTGAARPWLRSTNGSCALTADRDPAARVTFGVYGAETRKTVHIREIY